MSLVLLALLAATGSLLMLAYTPVPGDAYASIERLEGEVPFGAFVRAIHHWSANLLVLVAGLHLLRVVFTGGFLAGRGSTGSSDSCSSRAIAASAFTGYLLPWDQLAFWAVTIVTGMAGYVPGVGPALAELAARRRGDRPGDARHLLRAPHAVAARAALRRRRLPLLAGAPRERRRLASGRREMRSPTSFGARIESVKCPFRRTNSLVLGSLWGRVAWTSARARKPTSPAA